MAAHPFILFFYFLTEKINRIFSIFNKKIIDRNYRVNCASETCPVDGFLDDQKKGSDLLYGSKPFSYSGCAVAAVFNALLSLGIPMPLPDIIRHFEKHGASMFASFGTSPSSEFRFLKKLSSSTEKGGFTIKKSASRKGFRELSETSDILIFTIMNNRKKISRMLHTMCVECDNDPVAKPPLHRRFTVHNSHGKTETYLSYDEMMGSLGDGDNKADGVYMVGIRRA